jgi:hypothetical protein
MPRAPSRTRSRWSPRWAARPTPCCTCWRWPTPPACRCRSTTSRASAARDAGAGDLKPSGRMSWPTWCASAAPCPLMKTLLDEGPAARRLPDGDRKDPGREPGKASPDYPSRPGGHPPLRRPDQKGRPPGHPARQPRARRARWPRSPARRALRSPAGRVFDSEERRWRRFSARVRRAT